MFEEKPARCGHCKTGELMLDRNNLPSEQYRDYDGSMVEPFVIPGCSCCGQKQYRFFPDCLA